MTRLAPVILFAFVLVLAGCGTGSNNSGPSGSPTATTPTTTAECTPLSGAALTPRLSPTLASRATAYMTDLKLDTSKCSDRVVFTFEKMTPGPGFEVSYQPAARAKVEDGSGNAVKIDGSAFLVVRLTPALTAHITGDKVVPTYTGPRRITPQGFGHVREVVKTGDFESVVTWVIGVDGQRPFTTNASETQLVVELG
jgi:hypothetical protein